MIRKITSFIQERQAAVAPLTAICLVILLAGMALVVDLGHLYVVQAELQNAADAGAQAGAQALFNLSATIEPAPVIPLCDQARLAARQTVGSNAADGAALTIPEDDAQMGIWAFQSATGKWEFTPNISCSNDINAIRVITRKSEGVNGPVNLLFAPIFGRQTAALTAQAIAMLGWVKGLGKGRGVFPLALGSQYVPPPGGRMRVVFNPNWSDTGGWQTFFDHSPSSRSLQDLVTGATPSPNIKVGDMIRCTNGVDAAVINETYNQFYNVNQGHWIFILPVVQSDASYIQWREVLGFCAFEVTEVNGPPVKTIIGYSLGGYVAPDAETGGPNFGLQATLPKLVQ